MAVTTQQLARLLRDDWNSLGPQSLAEELYTMLTGGSLAGTRSALNALSNPTGSSSAATSGSTGATGSTSPSGTDSTAGTTNLGGPVLIPGTTNTSPVTLSNVTPSDGSSGLPGINIKFSDGSTGGMTFGFGGISFSVGGVDIGGFSLTQTVPVVGDQIQLQALPQAFPFTIVSGSGNNYQIMIFPNGMSQPGRQVPATSITPLDPDETIDEGTAGLAVLAGFDPVSGPLYWFSVPTWI